MCENGRSTQCALSSFAIALNIPFSFFLSSSFPISFQRIPCSTFVYGESWVLLVLQCFKVLRFVGDRTTKCCTRSYSLGDRWIRTPVRKLFFQLNVSSILVRVTCNILLDRCNRNRDSKISVEIREVRESTKRNARVLS